MNGTFVAWLAGTGRTVDRAQHDIALEAWNAAIESAAAACGVQVDRDAEYGGRFGGYGPFKGDMTGPECAAAIRKRLLVTPREA